MRRFRLGAAAALVVAVFGTSTAATQVHTARAPAAPRFFFAGNGHLTLSHGHFAEKLDVRYRRADGTYDPAALARIRHFFRSREDGREAPISLRLIELLAYIQDHFHPRQMTLLSGYRSPAFNADLRAAGQKAAQASLHTEGLAADVAFAGVDLKRLWEPTAPAAGGRRRLLPQRQVPAHRHRPAAFLGGDHLARRRKPGCRQRARVRAHRLRSLSEPDRRDPQPAQHHRVSAARRCRGAGGHRQRHARRCGSNRSSGAVERDGCLSIEGPADAYELRVVDAASAATGTGRGDIVLATCEPRIERTPPEIASNPIEIQRR